ncbi:MAG: BMC domain-containing protein [Ignavibacteriaceae bacterium]
MTDSVCIIETRSITVAFTAANIMLNHKNISLQQIDVRGEGIVTVIFSGEYSEVKNALEDSTLSVSDFSSYFNTKIITKPDEKLFKILKSGNAISEKSPFEPGRKTDLEKSKSSKKILSNKKYSNDDLMLIKQKNNKPGKITVTQEKDSLPVKKEVLINTDIKPILSQKSITENATIERLKLEALGKTYKEQESKDSMMQVNNSTEFSFAELEQLNVHKLRRYARSFDGFPIKGREISKANRGELLNYFKDII